MRLLVIVAGFMIVLASNAAFGHEWYSTSCCNDKDCRPVPSRVVKVVNGWYLPWLEETIEFDSFKIKPSQDMEFHYCIYDRIYNDSIIRCLYVPGGGT